MIKVSLRKVNGLRLPLHTRTRTITTTTSTSTHLVSVEPTTTLAILGGGLSGLSTAFYFLRNLSPTLKQSTRVIIYEKQLRSGGWCQSIAIPTPAHSHSENEVEQSNRSRSNSIESNQSTPNSDQAQLVFETGPRSIRPVGLPGWLTVELAHAIGLSSSILTVSKSAVSAKNRYVFYPNSLTLLPSSLLSALKALITTPLLRSTLPGVLSEPFRRRSPSHEMVNGGDESVDSFFKRRFGKPLAENMISAMIHGIYSGDTRRLSMRAIFPGVWEAEREWGSVILAALFGSFWRKRGWLPVSEYQKVLKRDDEKMEVIKSKLAETSEGKELIERMSGASVWGLTGGLEVLTNQLRTWLEKEGVEFRMGTAGTIESLSRVEDRWEIRTPVSTLQPTHLITTLPELLPVDIAPPLIPSATVSVINLAFPSPSPESPLFPPGFGYLIPRSVPTPMNPSNVLGVIFDSDVMPAVDTSAESLDLTKISVLLGGSYWLDGAPSPLPSHDQLVQSALDTLSLHFPTTSFPSPTYTMSHTHLNCIPQSPVGHSTYMKEFRRRLERMGKTAVAGGGTGAVGVNGAVKGAWEVGTSFAESVENGGGKKVLTGVEMW